MGRTRKSENQRMPLPDFKKKKEKLGAKRKRDETETRTDVRTKRIAVPRQAAIAKAAAAAAAAAPQSEQTAATTTNGAVSQKRLPPLDECLSRLTHTSEMVRRDALGSVADIASSAPDSVRVAAGTTLERVAMTLCDPDRDVRSKCRVALGSVLDALGTSAAAPFMQLVVAYLCSGLTHTSEAVRIDSAELAVVLADKYTPLARSFSSAVLPRFGSMIASSVPASRPQPRHPQDDGGLTKFHIGIMPIGVSSPRSKTVALTSLLRFLKDLSPVSKKGADGADSDADNTGVEKCTTEAWANGGWKTLSLGPLRRIPAPLPPERVAAAAALGSQERGADLNAADAAAILEALHAGLMEMLVDTAQTPVEGFAVLRNILETLDILFGKAVSNGAETDRLKPLVEQTTEHILACFPFSIPDTHRSQSERDKALSATVELNVLICRVFSRFLQRPTGEPSECSGGGTGSAASECTCWAQPLIAYVRNAMRGCLDGDASVDSVVGCRRLSPHVSLLVSRALPAFGVFLSHVPAGAERTGLLAAFSAFSDACSPSSAARLACVQFVSSSIPTVSLVVGGDMQQWTAQLPKLLWQLRESSPPTTSAVLSLLLRCANGSAVGSVDFVQDTLVPFFFTVVPSKSAAAQKPPRRVFGPFLDLPEALQVKCVYLLFAFPRVSATMERSLLACIFDRRCSPSVVRLIVELLEHSSASGHYVSVAGIIALASSALSSASAGVDGEQRGCAPASVNACVDAACESAVRVGGGQDFLASVASVLRAALTPKGLPKDAASSWPILRIADACCVPPSAVVLPEIAGEVVASAVSISLLTLGDVAGDAGVDRASVRELAETLCLRCGHSFLMRVVRGIVEQKESGKWRSALSTLIEMQKLRRQSLLLSTECRDAVLKAVSGCDVRHDDLSHSITLVYGN